MNDTKWYRISVVSIIHFFLTRGFRIIKELGFNSGPIIIAAVVALDNASFWLGLFALAFFATLLLNTLIRYWTFRFQISGNQIVVKQGFFTREVLNLKYDRIQNVNISVPWYFKPFKLVNCILDSAGSTGKEASIPGISNSFAQDIYKQIHNYHQEHNINETIIPELGEMPAQTTTSILKLTNREVTKYGFTHSMIFVMAAASFPVIEKIIEKAGWDFYSYLKQLAKYLPLPEIAAIIILVLISLIIFALLLMCFTALGSFIRFYNYELHNESSRLIKIAGLHYRQQISVQKQKIQGISIKQNVFARILNRVTVHFHQTQSEQNLFSKKQHLIIPMLKPEQWHQYILWVYNDFKIDKIKFEKISQYYLFRRSLTLLILPLTFVIYFLYISVSVYSLFLLSLIPVGIGMIWMRYRRYGYYMNEHFAIIRSGFIGVEYTLFPLYKLQNIIEKESFNQRKHQLCTTEFQLAFKKLQLPYLPRMVVNEIFNICLYRIESTEKN